MAIDFAGSQYAYTSGNNVATITNRMTLMAWVNIDAYTGMFNSIVNRQIDNTNGESFSILALNSGQYQAILTGTTSGAVSATGGTVSFGVWTHVAMTYNATLGSQRLKLFVNGTQVASAEPTGNVVSSTRELLIGANNNGTPLDPGEFMDGRIACVFIYTGALTPSQIQDIYDQRFAGTLPSSATEAGNLVGYYGLNDVVEGVAVTTSRSYAADGFDLTVVGNPLGVADPFFGWQV